MKGAAIARVRRRAKERQLRELVAANLHQEAMAFRRKTMLDGMVESRQDALLRRGLRWRKASSA